MKNKRKKILRRMRRKANKNKSTIKIKITGKKCGKAQFSVFMDSDPTHEYSRNVNIPSTTNVKVQNPGEIKTGTFYIEAPSSKGCQPNKLHATFEIVNNKAEITIKFAKN